MKDKSVTPLAIEALNGIRTEIREKGEVKLEFDESLKNATDQVDPLLYSYIWLLSMGEKYEVIKLRDKGRQGQDHSRNSTIQNNETDREEWLLFIRPRCMRIECFKMFLLIILLEISEDDDFQII